MLVVKPGGGATSDRSQDSHHKNNQHRDRHNNGMVLLFNGNYKIVNILEEKRCNNEVITWADPGLTHIAGKLFFNILLLKWANISIMNVFRFIVCWIYHFPLD